MGRHRHAIALSALGAATGVVTWVLVEHVADDGAAGGFAGWVAPGLVYGLAVAGWLHLQLRRSWRRLAWLVAGTVASWNAAVRLAAELYESADSFLLAGAAGGLAGAALVALGAALAEAAWRRPPAFVPVLAAGTLCGLLLAAGDGGLLLYVVWQGAVAAALGVVLDRLA